MTYTQKTCPECKSRNFRIVGTPGTMGVTVGLGWTGAPVDFYLCLDCGFGQLWMNTTNLEKVRKKLGVTTSN